METFNNKKQNNLMIEEDASMGEDTGDERNSNRRARIPGITLERGDSLAPVRSTTSGQDNRSEASTKSYDSEESSTTLYEEDEFGREIKKARKRGRPVTTGDYERKKRRDALRQEEQRREMERIEEQRILDDSYVPPETKASLNIPSVEDIMEELRDAPTPDVSAEIKKARKRGRPVTTGDYERKKRKDALRQEESRREIERLEEQRILDDSYVPPETKTSLNIPSMEDIMEELRDASTPDVSARALEHLQRVHRVAAVSKNLKGTFVNQLKTAVNVGKACATTLAIRAQNIGAPEVEKSEAEELRKQLRAIRMENLRLQKEAEQARENLRMAMECQNVNYPSKTVNTSTVQEDMTTDFPVNQVECEDSVATSVTLPPRKEWPQAARPPIKGIPKVLED
ncbi:uncharacterized protein LOC115237641 [Formica exsecta]|uniref:uncharacterized protein LOC115237641 n=1 Tax=Formica exsecta TaxID=72781 RepID=UPI0011434297|nr:uncharacterized protein LOC115237641 [Formica exsecta]